MPSASLFRKEAIKHQSTREPLDRVAQVTVPYDWWVLLLLAAVCLFVVFWAAFVKVELTLPVDVMVIKPTDDRTVVSPMTGRVSDVLVDVGVRVDAGDALVRVVAPDLRRRLTEAMERERIIREEVRLMAGDENELTRLLIESRAESAALVVAIENDEVISSPYSGEIVDLSVSAGHVATVGQEIVLVRIAESAETFAITFISHVSSERVSINSDVLLSCTGPHGDETLTARVISDPPQDLVDSNFVSDAGFDPNNHQVSLMLSESASIAHGTLCEGHIPLNPRTPLEILLGTTQGSK